MAELSGLLSTEETKSIHCDVDWLDYGYVRNCNDASKLRLILDTLRSGKEGSYPEVSIIYFLSIFIVNLLNKIFFF